MLFYIQCVGGVCMFLDQSPEPNDTNALAAQEGINAHFWDHTVGRALAQTTVVLSAREIASKGKPSRGVFTGEAQTPEALLISENRLNLRTKHFREDSPVP